MENQTNPKSDSPKPTAVKVPWSPWLAVVAALFIYIFTQVVAIWIVSIYPATKHWSEKMTDDWLTNDIAAQFFYVLLAEVMSVGLVWGFVRLFKQTLRIIGLLKPKAVDAVYTFVGFVIYFPVYIAVATLLTQLIPSFNPSQSQDIGFTNPAGAGQMIMVFISLVILPPIAEEIIFRGLLYTSMRSRMRGIWAALIVSALFAAPHLLEGGNTGLLWIAGVDTFILSLVLCGLREKTGRLYAGMGLHATKNLIAFISLYGLFGLHWH